MAAPLPTLLTGDVYAIDLGEAKATPTLVEALRGEHILEMSGAFAKTALLTGNGVAKRVEPGSTDAEPMEALSGLNGMLAQVAFGSKHMAALTHSGQVYTLGSGVMGQLGHGNTKGDEEPKLVQTLANRAIAQVACGRAHSLALTAEGDVYSWGAADEGQLGTGRTNPTFVPRYLNLLHGTPIAMISTGAAHCAALSVYGRVYTWGEALCGQLGLGHPLRAQDLPVEVTTLPDSQSVACGEFHTVALSAEGDVYSWGLATRGPPTSRKMTPLPEKLDGLSAPVASIACGGGSTVLIGSSGEVLCWPDGGREMQQVAIPAGLCASRIACAGSGALIFVETSITSIVPSCSPIDGGALLQIHGAGFYESQAIVIRLTHASGQQKLVRGMLAMDGSGGLVVSAEAPSFVESGAGMVDVSVSFEEGEADTFTSSPVQMRVYQPPSLGAALPCCAPAGQPTKVLLKPKGGASTIFDAASAKAFFYYNSKDAAVFAIVPAVYDADGEAMLIETPICEEPQPEAYVRLAMDGQTAAKEGQPVHLHAPIAVTALTPRCGPAAGGTKIAVGGTSFFGSPHISARFTVAPPPPAPPAPPTPEPEPPAEEEGAEGAEPPAEPPAEGEEVEPVPEPAPPPPPPPPRLDEGMVFDVVGSYDSATNEVFFTMPAQAGVADLAAEITFDGVHYAPVPNDFTLSAPTSLVKVTPACGSLNGGTKLCVSGNGLINSPDLAILFVKGATRKVVPATYDEALGCMTCTTPVWPPAVAVAKSVAAAAAAAAANPPAEGEEPVALPPLDLTDAGDSIIELSLNGQQWTTDCKHFSFVGDPELSGCDPAVGVLEGDFPIKVLAQHVADTGVLKARFTKLPAVVEEGEAPTLPTGDDVTAIEVDATFCESADGVDVTAPVFEDVTEPFDVVVQLSNDGQIYGPSLALFKFEASAGKGKGGKKK